MNMTTSPIILDCTLRDGGYYNAWDFPRELIGRYLAAMKAAGVDIAELGFRFLHNSGFKGPCAFSTDEFLRTLEIPDGLGVSVMVNGADLLTEFGFERTLERMFPVRAEDSPVELVRIACHFQEFTPVLPAASWLTERGYKVGINVMQIADRSKDEIRELARAASCRPLDVLYFADSMGSMSPDDAVEIIACLREEWAGPIGVHTHDNLGLALQNTLASWKAGASWLDATVTGMGRGPGNARTEELVIEIADIPSRNVNLIPLLSLITGDFGPLKAQYGWGSNPYYYLSGRHGIHPSYIQAMLADVRYGEEDILAVIDHLREVGGKKFSHGTLEGARNFYRGEPRGTWNPAGMLEGRDVLLIGSGPGVARHREALEGFIRASQPMVLALNTQTAIASKLIDLRIACHPVRLMADCATHQTLPQPLIAPASMLPDYLRSELDGKELLDFGLGVKPATFAFGDTHCIAPSSLVLAYALAVATSGKARSILMAGFDGYAPGDPRNAEVEELLASFDKSDGTPPCLSITPTSYRLLRSQSVYGLFPCAPA